MVEHHSSSINHVIAQRTREPFAKRPFDIFLSGIGLVLSAWLWALIWIAVLIEDGPPVLIKQERIGKHGKLFSSLKFRSMEKSSLNERVNIQAGENDPRVTWVGKLLRKTALDELPQLLSIFIGDMSFVGPRPLLPREVEVTSNEAIHIEDIPGFRKRILVRPGLTGIAQVYAPRDLLRRHKFKYDLLYIRKRSFLLDIKLILLSFLVTFKGSWEKRSIKLPFLRQW
jgi:lipopolysaccharide/colanic/teichoic acid biosynthesis glycosyltransferase